MESLLILPQPTRKTMQEQTSEPEDFGVATVSAHFLMSRFLTQTRNHTNGHPWSLASDARKMPRNESMNNASLKWSTAHLRPWFSPPQAEWGTWRPHSTRDWLHSCQRRDRRPTHPHWAGFALTSVFPCSDLQSCAYGELDQVPSTW